MTQIKIKVGHELKETDIMELVEFKQLKTLKLFGDRMPTPTIEFHLKEEKEGAVLFMRPPLGADHYILKGSRLIIEFS